MLQNAYLLAKIGADRAVNERNFAEILPKFCQNLATSARPHVMPKNFLVGRVLWQAADEDRVVAGERWAQVAHVPGLKKRNPDAVDVRRNADVTFF